MKPVFEVVIDHTNPKHDEQLDRATRELFAWAQQMKCTTLIREEQEIRPGVVRLRFLPNRASATRISRDSLVLSRSRA